MTDPTSGMSYGLTAASLVAHQRDGTPVPNPPELVPIQLNTPPGTSGTGGPGRALVATVDGLGTAYSGDHPTGLSTWVQKVDTTLAPSGEAIAVPGEPVVTPWDATVFDSSHDLALQPRTSGWWLVGNPSYRSIDEYLVESGKSAVRRVLVTYSEQALAWAGFDSRYFESARQNDELWFGFQDKSNTDPVMKAEQPFRVIRVKQDCVYKSMTDIEHGW